MSNKPERVQRLPLVVIISGPPGTGKTTLGRQLATDLRLPFVTKDGIKETLFDALGWSDREWSRKLGEATYQILYYFMELLLASGTSYIVESNFAAGYATEEFRSLMDRHPFTPFQVQCYADGATLLKRFAERSVSGERHPGHVDHTNIEEIKPTLLKGHLEPLQIGGTIYPLDTTGFSTKEYTALKSAIEAILK